MIREHTPYKPKCNLARCIDIVVVAMFASPSVTLLAKEVKLFDLLISCSHQFSKDKRPGLCVSAVPLRHQAAIFMAS